MEKDGKTWYCWAESCYHFSSSNEREIKSVADSKCEKLRSHVLALETAEELDAILDIMKRYGKTQISFPCLIYIIRF